MADEIGIPRRRDYRRAAQRVVGAAARAAFWGLPPVLLRASQSDPPHRMKRRRGTPAEEAYDFAMGGGGTVPRGVKTYVKRCMTSMIEKKAIDQVFLSAQVPGTAGAVYTIGSGGIVQGTSDVTRVGNFIDIKKVYLRFIVQEPANTQTFANYASLITGGHYRIVIVKDTQTNGTAPTAAEILSTASNTRSGYDGNNVNLAGGKRLQVLRDIFGCINAQTLGSSSTNFSIPIQSKTFHITLNPKKGNKAVTSVHYDGVAGNVGDIVSGEIFVLIVCNATMTWNGNAQILYADG